MFLGTDYETAHTNIAKGAEMALKNPRAVQSGPQYAPPVGMLLRSSLEIK